MSLRQSSIKAPLVLYGLLLSLLYAIVAAGQVLGILRAYTPVAASLFTLAVMILGGWLYFRWIPASFSDSLSPDGTHERARLLDWIFYGAGTLVTVVAFVIPLIRWPLAEINEVDFWDAAGYHLPKAIELFRSGSAWDLSIPYGQYPFGFEALLSQGLALSGDTRLFGLIHALIAVFLLLTLWLLACRYSNLAPSLLFFVVSLLLVAGRVVQAGNPWWFLGYLLFSVGMNDVFLAAGLLAAILHAPVTFGREKPSLHPVGLAMASMLALSTKPNSVLVIVFLWVLALYAALKARPRESPQVLRRRALFAVLLIAPGLLWALRNLIVMKTFFTPGALLLGDFSIASNLTNPFFYRHIPRNLIGVTGLLLASALGTVWKRFPSWRFTVTFLILLVSFALTPVSGFFYSTDVPAQISWRLGLALLGFSFLALLSLLRPFLAHIYQATVTWAPTRRGLIVAVVVTTLTVLWQQRHMLETHPANERLLRDQFQQSVGVGGYASAYDFVHKNLRGAVIQVENGLPYYVYGPGFTNSPTTLSYPVGRPSLVPQLEPEYYLIFRTEWWLGGGSFPEELERSEWADSWALIYQDSEGRLYKRR